MRTVLAASAAFALMSAGVILPATAMAGPNCGSMSPPGESWYSNNLGQGVGQCQTWGAGREDKNGPGVSSAETQTAPNVMGEPETGNQQHR